MNKSSNIMKSTINIHTKYSIPNSYLANLPYKLRQITEKIIEHRIVKAPDIYEILFDKEISLYDLCLSASAIRNSVKKNIVTFSPKIFVPLTQVCSDVCSYCTFREDPKSYDEIFLSKEYVLNLAHKANTLGCKEVLFTLGERPERKFPLVKTWLNDHGFYSTIEYLAYISELVATKTNLFPHGNPGTMTRNDMKILRNSNISLGLMLENISERLSEPGGPHEFAISKRPTARLKTIVNAGKLQIPFTTGILVGIGETKKERIDSIFALQDINKEYGHIQELIIQNFRAKEDIPMSRHPEPLISDFLWTIAATRIIMGPYANIQVPPNLNAGYYENFLGAGINDWGGISPLTIDYVNPEAPWPSIEQLYNKTLECGFELKPRLPIYPEFITEKHLQFQNSELLSEKIKSSVDDQGYVNGGIFNYVKVKNPTIA
jgi:7,8-didemethyl-8-hydroxy-5-deazariboflavin synthase CofG subunit